MASDLAQLSVNTIRVLAADIVEKANSGHPGMPMGMAPIAYVLWRRFHRFSPQNPKWPGRDRFVLSNGHGSALQYALLHLAGYSSVPLKELKQFRQLNSKTPGHPESYVTDGVEVTTGPLGQGIANGVGMALAEAHMAAVYNKPGFKLFDNYTYVFLGDGCLQEGVSHEAASLAGHWNLNKLICCYDDNHVSIDGNTKLSFTEDVLKRFEAYGWHTMRVKKADTDLAAIEQALAVARQQSKPTIIAFETTIGYGAPKGGTEHVHGAPLGKKDLAATKKRFGFNPAQSFFVPPEVYEDFKEAATRGTLEERQWQDMLQRYQQQYPKLAAELQRRLSGELPENLASVLPRFTPKDKPDATRNLSLRVLNALAPALPELVGGSADLAPSNKTYYKGAKPFQRDCRSGRYLHFGIREHAMAAIANGLHAFGGFLPFTATFLNFIEYAYGAVRISALSHHQQIYVMTHDSIFLGEDGPTHQAVEALTLTRATPNILTIRPCDGNETSGAYLAACLHKRGPTVLALSRQNLPNLPTSSIESVLKGGYVVSEDASRPDVIVVATGSEVSLALAAAKLLRAKGMKLRVVSMPCCELFDKQPLQYRRQILTPGIPIVSVEALGVTGWEKYAHYSIGMRSFGTSAPPDVCADVFGFTPAKVAATITTYLKKARADAAKFQTGFPGLVQAQLADIMPRNPLAHHAPAIASRI